MSSSSRHPRPVDARWPWWSALGLLACLGSVPLGLDAVGSPGLFTGLHQRILTGYILDAMEGREVRGQHAPPPSSHQEPAPASVAEAFVEAARATERTPSESVGLGEYRILRGEALGGELAHENHLVHLSAFPVQENRNPGQGECPNGENGPRGARGIPIARPSRRRRRF